MSTKIGVLDQSPIHEGETAAQVHFVIRLS